LKGKIVMEQLPKEELSLLLYFESRAVDNGGTLQSVRMNQSDFETAKRWNAKGFVSFGRIAAADLKRYEGLATDHWCVLSDSAWAVAHAERRARAERRMSKLDIELSCLVKSA
jgi:hypothetical protein